MLARCCPLRASKQASAELPFGRSDSRPDPVGVQSASRIARSSVAGARVLLSQTPFHDPAHEPLPDFADEWFKRWDRGGDVTRWYTSEPTPAEMSNSATPASTASPNARRLHLPERARVHPPSQPVRVVELDAASAGTDDGRRRCAGVVVGDSQASPRRRSDQPGAVVRHDHLSLRRSRSRCTSRTSSGSRTNSESCSRTTPSPCNSCSTDCRCTSSRCIRR